MMFVPNGGVIWWVTFILGEKKFYQQSGYSY